MGIVNKGLSLLGMLVIMSTPLTAMGQEPELPPLAKMCDANNNNRIERDEAAGPLVGNFDTMDCDKSGNLDGKEILGFFQGIDCPKKPDSNRLLQSQPLRDRLMNYFLISTYRELFQCLRLLLNHGRGQLNHQPRA